MASQVERYWEQFVENLPAGAAPPRRYVDAFRFGMRPEDAAEINPLVLAGTKTATGSLLWSYEFDRKPLPTTGDLWVVLGSQDEPVCIIETVEVRILPFGEVGEDHAWEGGEGDRSLAGWRRMYWNYIVSECARIGRQPCEDAPLVMERFRVAYGAPPRA